MRTTVRIDDSLLRELKEEAQRDGTSLAKLMNRVIREGLTSMRQRNKAARPYREKTFRMGQPKVDLHKALALAASLEDAEVREELARRK